MSPPNAFVSNITAAMASNDSTSTHLPYQKGDLIQLEVLKNYLDPPLPQPCRASIVRVFTVTMSPVMDIIIWRKPGTHIRAVLKLYDRRFGTDLRDCYNKHRPHTPAGEAAFQSFVRQRKMQAFLRELEEEEEAENLMLRPSRQLYDEEDGQNLKNDTESIAKYEAALWRECNTYFDNETEAYDRLREVQGKSIPQIYGHVRLLVPSPDVPPDLRQSPYFEVKGVLLQWINGYNLTDLPVSPMAPSDTDEWAEIIQTAVDAAHDINKRGVIMADCQPRNVVVDRRSQVPFLIDFAQCDFKDRIMEPCRRWREEDDGEGEGEGEGEEPNPEAEYWELVLSTDNPGAIGAVMRMKVLRNKGTELDIKYPDREKIYQDIKHGTNADNE
ncbi:putative serine/threonine-protein kinase fnkB [Madurella mycetomatis]|uniref:Serine/threonine-protein kinase fnkB n=1 Tax=Madurella mycetomatis TaxID=100816 RepID=A0A175WFV8_9PEZI|nr:putative serine/threonine-protein kinase fnkB [Madurella mycetomatis]